MIAIAVTAVNELNSSGSSASITQLLWLLLLIILVLFLLLLLTIRNDVILLFNIIVSISLISTCWWRNLDRRNYCVGRWRRGSVDIIAIVVILDTAIERGGSKLALFVQESSNWSGLLGRSIPWELLRRLLIEVNREESMEVFIFLVMELITRNVTSKIAVFIVVGGELVVIKEKVFTVVLQLLNRLRVFNRRKCFFNSVSGLGRVVWLLEVRGNHSIVVGGSIVEHDCVEGVCSCREGGWS